MNAEIALASVLRSVGDSIDELPTGFVADVLFGVADGLEASKHTCHVHIHSQGGADAEAPAAAPQKTEAPAKAPVASAPTAPAPVEDAAASDASNEDDEYEYPTDGEIAVGDEWKLKDGLKHTDGREVVWREVTEDLVGNEIANYTKSVIRRRKVSAEFDYPTEGVILAGDEWKLKDGLRHTDGRAVEWREVGEDLIGKPLANYTKSVLRRRK